MTTLLQDFRYSARVLLKNPGFAAVTVLVLALGIGANTAIFSVVNAVLLRPLPFPGADRLVRVWHVPPAKSFPGIPLFAVSAANYLDWQNQNHVFDRTTIYSFRTFNLTGGSNPESITGAAVSSDFLSVLEAQPILGRDFRPDEDRPGHDHVVLLSYGFWQSHFGANPNIVGQQINLNNQSYLVAGVMPKKFQLADFAPQLWAPLGWTDEERSVRGEHHYLVIARLKRGITIPQAQAELDTISKRLAQQYPEDDNGWGAKVLSLRDDFVNDVRPALLVLLGAVAFVLLIACANVANLVLAKAFARRKEIAIRSALGASSSRVLSQLLSETVLLAILGGALGLLVAHFGVRLITASLADKLPRSAEVALDRSVLGFTLLISLLTGIAAGILPAFRLVKTDLNEALKQGLGRTDADSGGFRTRSALVVSEVALSLVLLIGAGLFIRSLSRLHSVDPGFDAHNVLTIYVAVPDKKLPTPAQEASFFDQILQRVRALPGVDSASVIDNLPLDGGGSHQPIAIEGRPNLPMAEQPEVDVRLASTQYLRVMHIPVVRGRDFNDADVAARPGVVLISESMAKRFWPNEDAIGKHLTLSFFPDKPREIVGIVGNTKLEALNETRDTATLYVPLDQVSAPSTGGWNSFGLSLAVRSTGNPTGVVSAVTNAVHQVDRDTPVLSVRSMEDIIAESLSSQKVNMLLLAAFAGLALLLAAVGIYSVLSYSVRRRVREIGIRMALGAQIGDVLRLIVVDGMKPALIGMGIGLAAALALGRLLSSLIYGITATDPFTFGAVALLLGMVALCASAIPAYRASRFEPTKALRDE
ncbi:MAG TPA: ABC transporter permease [Terriglobales bacterium]|nr:ABC transporter permease [Terriglobales bacterium]